MSAGMTPSTATRSSARPSLVCGRPGPVRYGWSSSSGSVDMNLPTTSTSIGGTHHETDGRCRASADVECPECPGALDLVVARRPAHLPDRAHDHPHTGCPDRMAATDQSAAGVDGQSATNADVAVLDCLPRLAWRRETDMVDREILARCEAIVHFKSAEVVEREPAATKRILHRCSQMRKNIRVFDRTIEL